MRVLFWTSTFLPAVGGIEILAAKFLPALRERDHECIVVTPQRSPDQTEVADYSGIPVYRFPFRDARTYQDIDRLVEVRQKVAQLKRSFAPDLVHINALNHGDFFLHTTAKVHPAPMVVSLHGHWEHFTGRWAALTARTLRSADWVVGCSEAMLRTGQHCAPEIVPHSSVIYNALEPPSLLPTPLPYDEPLVLCLGRLAEVKGVDLAIQAFHTVIQDCPQARLVIAGEGACRPALENLASKLGLRNRVTFVGFVAPETVPALLNTASLVVIPSRHEAFSLVALEAAFMARPVVATQVGGLPEVIEHQQTGLLVERENTLALAQAIRLLLTHPETASRMGRAARQRASRRFSWEHYVDAYETLYHRVTAAPDSSRV